MPASSPSGPRKRRSSPSKRKVVSKPPKKKGSGSPTEKRKRPSANTSEASRGTSQGKRKDAKRSGDKRPKAKRSRDGRPGVARLGAARSSDRTRAKTEDVEHRASGSASTAPRVDPRIAKRKDEVARKVGHRRILIATALLSVPALVASAFLVLHTSLFALGKVTVNGAHETSSQAIVNVAGLEQHPPLIDVNPVVVATKIEALPWIASADVVRHWPKSVTIDVTERVPVVQSSRGPHRWEIFDQRGRALGYRAHRTRGLVRIKAADAMPAPGESARGAFADEVTLADAVPVALVPQVFEISYSLRDGLIADLSSHVTVIFGSTSAISEKMVALDTLLTNHVSLAGVTSIDLSVPSSPILTPPVAISRPTKG